MVLLTAIIVTTHSYPYSPQKINFPIGDVRKMVGIKPSFSRHAKAGASSALVIWLLENVPQLEVEESLEPVAHDDAVLL